MRGEVEVGVELSLVACGYVGLVLTGIGSIITTLRIHMRRKGHMMIYHHSLGMRISMLRNL